MYYQPIDSRAWKTNQPNVRSTLRLGPYTDQDEALIQQYQSALNKVTWFSSMQKGLSVAISNLLKVIIAYFDPEVSQECNSSQAVSTRQLIKDTIIGHLEHSVPFSLSAGNLRDSINAEIIIGQTVWNHAYMRHRWRHMFGLLEDDLRQQFAASNRLMHKHLHEALMVRTRLNHRIDEPDSEGSDF